MCEKQHSSCRDPSVDPKPFPFEEGEETTHLVPCTGPVQPAGYCRPGRLLQGRRCAAPAAPVLARAARGRTRVAPQAGSRAGVHEGWEGSALHAGGAAGEGLPGLGAVHGLRPVACVGIARASGPCSAPAPASVVLNVQVSSCFLGGSCGSGCSRCNGKLGLEPALHLTCQGVGTCQAVTARCRR